MSPPRSLTHIIVLLGVLSSIASDAGYLVLIPLGAAAFKSVGRHPLAGIAAAFAGVAGGLWRELPDHAARRRPDRDHQRGDRPVEHAIIDLVSNLCFGIGSTVFVVVVLTFVTPLRREPPGQIRPCLAGPGGARTRTRPAGSPRMRPADCAMRSGGLPPWSCDRAADGDPGSAAAQPVTGRSSATRRSWTA